MRKICTKFVSYVLREDQKERRCHDSREMVEIINSDPAVLEALMTCDESWIYCYDPGTKRQTSQWKHAGSSRPKKAIQSKSINKLLMILFFFIALAWSTCTGFPLDIQSTKNTMLRFKGSSGRDFVGRSQHSSNRVSGISTRTMHQSTTPSLSRTIWPRWASRQFLTLPLVQTFLPVTFGYSLSSRKILEAVIMKQGDERVCDEGHWHAHTRGLPWGLPEVVGTVQQVHCSRRRLLRRGLECTINKSTYTKKVWKLIK